MDIFFVLTAILAVRLVSTVASHPCELTEDFFNNPRYLIYENDEGCLDVEDLYNSTTRTLRTITENQVSFYFFTPENREYGVQIRKSQLPQIVELTGFSISRETLVVIHGWKNNFESPVNDFIKNAALRNKDINVIVVDWSPIASRSYANAQVNVLPIGNHVGDFLIRLDDELSHRLDKVTIVGHSLGAHIAGNAGARTKGIIQTIIGLDPAGPLFTVANIHNRLDPTDGNYVHVIHTNDGLLGFNTKMGHVDYYPNGGKTQPGCGIDMSGSCAHSRAYQYFSESLNNDGFRAKRCHGWSAYQNKQCSFNEMSYMGGFPVQIANFGDYYLTTNRNSLFAQG